MRRGLAIQSEPDLNCIINGLEAKQFPATTIGDFEWPEPHDFASELPEVDEFQESFLPQSLRPLCADIADRMQVPLDYPGIVALECLAGAVNRRMRMQPKAYDTSWQLTPNLWGAIIGPPGVLKSPTMAAIAKPMHQIENQWRVEYKENEQDYVLQKEEHELKLAAWREEFKKRTKSKQLPPARPDGEPVPPKQPRLVVNQTTLQALHQILSNNNAGIFAFWDELIGWIEQLSQAGHEGDRQFYLQGWNGDSPYTIDTIGRGSIHVPGLCISLFGALTPARLRGHLSDALKDGPSNDGLIQRFQLLVWPDVGSWRNVDRAPNEDAQQLVYGVMNKLVSLDCETPKQMRFSAGAQVLFDNWLADLERELRSDEQHPALTAHLAKYRKLMPSLAGLSQLADWAAGHDSDEDVSEFHTERAIRICAYLKSHAHRVYSCVVTPQVRSAKALADKIRSGKVGSGNGDFTLREIYLKGWMDLNTPESARSAAEFLVEADWLRRLPAASNPAGGRPSDRYLINPLVRRRQKPGADNA